MFKQLKEHFISVKYYYLFLLGLILIFLFSYFNNKNLKKNGIYTIAKILKYETGGDGGLLYIQVNYNSKIFDNTANEFPNGRIGKFYFVQILKGLPQGNLILTNIQVPHCILDSLETKLPSEGWKEIPKDTCK